MRLPVSFDASRLNADLEQLCAAEWTPHFVERNYEGSWCALPLRAPRGASHPILQIAANPDTDAWEPTRWLEQSPYFSAVLAAFRCDIAGTRLMRLAPGSVVKEHRDQRLGLEWGSARLHIPIVTNDEVDFRINGTRLFMGPGETWYLRLSDPHSVRNHGSCDRVHLVIDAIVNPWLEALLDEGARTHV